MKQFFSLLFFLLTIFVNAQTINPANRLKTELHFVKKIEMTTTTKMQSSDFNFTSGLDTKTSASYRVSETTTQGASVEAKVFKMKSHSYSSMGKDIYYDSENPQAGDSKEAEMFGATIGTITKVTLDENAIVTNVLINSSSPKIQKGNDYSLMMKGRIFDIFLNTKKLRKIGDSWTDSIATPEAKTVEKYTYKSFEEGIAMVEVNSTATVNQKVEGTEDDAPKQITVTLTTISTLQVDITTLLVKKRTSTTTSMNIIGVGEKKISSSSVINSIETIE